MEAEGEGEEEFLYLLEQNRRKGLSQEDLNELNGYETFGPISIYEYPNRTELELADGSEGIRESIEINTGNGKIFWDVFQDTAIDDNTLDESIKKHYSKGTRRSSGRDILARELEMYTDSSGDIKEDYRDHVIDLLDFKLEYFDKEELNDEELKFRN